MEWHDKSFENLTNHELLQIFKLRAQVFNLEQDSTFPDPDDQDQLARHVFALDGNRLVAYARYFQEGDKATFGRVIVDPAYRQRGLGKILVHHVMDGIQQHAAGLKIVIHAQYYVRRFYAAFGFQETGQPFMEANRKHIAMIHSALH